MRGFTGILKEAQTSIEVEKSKFITFAAPIHSEAEAIQFIKRIKKEHYNATHHVSAYVIDSQGPLHRYTDDGEPSGTAGMPTLNRMLYAEMDNVCMVTVRYFGGIKLGTGGLARAYSDAAQACIDQAELIRYIPMHAFRVQTGYEYLSSVQHIMKEASVLQGETQYLENVEISFYLEESQMYFLESLIERTANRIQLLDDGELLVAITQDGKIRDTREVE